MFPSAKDRVLEVIVDLPKGTLIDIGPNDNLAHLPEHLIEFVCDPANTRAIEDAYIKTEYEKKGRGGCSHTSTG